MKQKPPKRTIFIWILITIGFSAMEFPGVFFFGERVYPFILGMPFIYGYIFCCWIYMCAVVFYAYKTRWGKQPLFPKKQH